MEEFVAKAAGDETVMPIILRPQTAMFVIDAYLSVYPCRHDNFMNKNTQNK